MSVHLVCSCGKRWISESGEGVSAALCPDCGRRLTPLVAGGWRSLWPRLTLAAVFTILFVLVTSVVLIHWLPAPDRQKPPSASATASVPLPEAEQRKPVPPTAENGRPARTPDAKSTLPLLDNPPPVAAVLENPKRSRPADTVPVKPLELPPKSTPALQAMDDFYQQVVISRLSRYRILDMDLGQNVQYVLVSRFHEKKKNDDGSRVVEQKVVGVRLSNADPSLQVRLNELLQKTKGVTFTMTLDARREVTKFEGGQEAVEVFAGANPLGGPSFLLWSFLDRDGWKELAQLSFFQPPSQVRRGQRWDRSMTHSWGPLGHWSGKVHYQLTGKQAEGDRFDYVLDLTYKPPGKGGGLPFTIGQSRFQVQTARGVIAYQPRRKRVATAEERFHVRGQLTISFLGVESAVQMDEMQLFQLRILDRNPLKP